MKSSQTQDKDVVLKKECNASLSSLDQLIEKKWLEAQEKGVFRYNVSRGGLVYKTLPGKFRFVPQFNDNRGILRRKPQATTLLKMPFNEQLFNFTKVSEDEILLRVHVEGSQEVKGVLVINDSPIEFLSSLLVPSLELKLPQVLTQDSLLLALHFFANCNNRFLRMGFNSLGAAASVNHLHWHVYHFEHFLEVEETLCDDNNMLAEWPVYGFCWDINNLSSTSFKILSETIMKIVDKCYEGNIAYNCFITRKTRSIEDTIRFILWPRLPDFGRKNDMGIIAAFCEFSGFFICKTKESFDLLTEEECLQVISSVSLTKEKMFDLHH